MLRITQTCALALAVQVTAYGTPALAQLPSPAPVLDNTLSLSAHGGVRLKVPNWTRSREDSDLAILEHVPSRSQAFAMFMVAIEKTAPTLKTVPWTKIEENIENAASRSDATNLSLTAAGTFSDATGWQGQRYTGSLAQGERRSHVALLALVANERLVTLTLITPEPSDASWGWLASLARSVSLP